MEEISHQRQHLKDGYGAVFHRVYSVVFPADEKSARQAMRELQCDPNKFSPHLLATFKKVTGQDGDLKCGDEFQIYISGPWNGPVRVGDVCAENFRFVTLEGHLEAGQIRFSILPSTEKNKMVFKIESLSRSRDGVVDFVYDKVPVAKFAQTEMWKFFCTRFAERARELAGLDEEPVSEVEILTERRDEENGEWTEI